MKSLLYLLLCVCLLACSSKKEDPTPPVPPATPATPPLISVSVNGAAPVALTGTGVAGFSLGGGGDATALYALTISGVLPSSDAVLIDFAPSLTQPATKASTPLNKLTLSKPGLLVGSSGTLTGTASNNAATNTASGTFSGTLTDGTRISGTFSGASTKK